MAGQENSIVPVERIRWCIFMLRGDKVMLDRDLAELYGVDTKVLNQAVKRNKERFPEDFMFKLDKQEADQLVTNCDRFEPMKHAGTTPYAFTEQGIAMLSSVLRSKRAVEVNIAIMRTFVQLRRILADNAMLREKIEAIEKKYDEQFQQVFAVLQAMVAEEEQPPKPPIGYYTEARKNERGKALRKARK
ncbi:MAG: ORF6N domain-containing protein [Planctomycetaceae bacterium]|nr:ORF6N domain-containing protein [Planctomycetaceae bacterium]